MFLSSFRFRNAPNDDKSSRVAIPTSGTLIPRISQDVFIVMYALGCLPDRMWPNYTISPNIMNYY